VTITFEIPHDIERDLSADGTDLNDEAREAFLVELYRRHKISQHQLGMALGVDDFEADEILKRHGVALEISNDDQKAESDSFRKAGPG